MRDSGGALSVHVVPKPKGRPKKLNLSSYFLIPHPLLAPTTTSVFLDQNYREAHLLLLLRGIHSCDIWPEHDERLSTDCLAASMKDTIVFASHESKKRRHSRWSA